jgi:2-keto-4-pentenoate hydratase/2-oxohepta-3-ene-1,7-dioic acid hydratase in catechol pathway
MMIRNIWAVGRNYTDHAKELGNETPTSPFFFLKAGSSATVYSSEITLPWWTEEVHHEIELALKFNSNLGIVEAAVALDLTERKLQNAAKKASLPWTLAKSFDGACAVSAFFNFHKLEELSDLRLRLWVNDELRQEGRTSQMVFGIPQLIEYVLGHYPVCAGDLLLTGTPAGVGPLQAGDRVKAEIEGQITHQWVVKKEAPPLAAKPTS